ncbi:MAG: TlpA family protein disulfide reductase [Muribaculaceae bacterium]|nr:TlpA family protein disulfide reductase [Muribaculaceae bacterium]
MKRIFLLIIVVVSSIGYMMGDITVSVPKKWKNRTIYVWQTDINQVFNRQDGEPLNQVKDTIIIKELTFTLPVKLNCATNVNVITPKKDETDYDHTIAEACLMPGEDVHLYLSDSQVISEGSLLNQQMAEINTYYMQSLVPYIEAYTSGNKERAARIASESQQWYVDWIKEHSDAPGAGVALYQLVNPQLVVELSDMLHGDALISLFYPYTENHINRCRQILQRKEAQRTLSEKGETAPDFTLNDMAGNKVSLSDFRGKWVIIDFWGSWCTPCLKGMPELKEIYETYTGRLEIIGVDCNDKEDAWKDAVSRLQLPWIQLFQSENDSVTSLYAVSAYPTKVVVDPNGIIRRIYTGASPSFKNDLAEWLK